MRNEESWSSAAIIGQYQLAQLADKTPEQTFRSEKETGRGLDQSRDKFHFINLDSVVGRGHPSHNRQAVLDRPRCLFHPKMDLLPKHLSTHLSHRWIRVHQSDREGRKKKADGKRERACRVNNGDVLKHLLPNVRVGPIDRPNRLPVLSTWIKEMIKRQIEKEETHTQVDNGILREEKKQDIFINKNRNIRYEKKKKKKKKEHAFIWIDLWIAFWLVNKHLSHLCDLFVLFFFCFFPWWGHCLAALCLGL